MCFNSYKHKKDNKQTYIHTNQKKKQKQKAITFQTTKYTREKRKKKKNKKQKKQKI